jgi:hypothetical protein
MSLFKQLQDVLVFNSSRSKKELEDDLTEDGFTNYVEDKGTQRSVVAVILKINKDKN